MCSNKGTCLGACSSVNQVQGVFRQTAWCSEDGQVPVKNPRFRRDILGHMGLYGDMFRREPNKGDVPG